jgi:hypothetical protein
VNGVCYGELKHDPAKGWWFVSAISGIRSISRKRSAYDALPTKVALAIYGEIKSTMHERGDDGGA